ncbi:hypothetical protein FANTH_10177 [Fusarium anthophilum]|uniref:Uncharacterized protein n=1 Tax=Fusarium anthophilum TaxID=48485 RepID=A0A8H5DWX4_9HYPO|nr:hypothetical protein FANTH_10177 [Fusarium anthophilum]
MHLSLFALTLLASVAAARDFTLYEHANYKGASHRETRNDDNACWNMNGKGDQASSVKGKGCTTFYRERDCKGDQWENVEDAPTVPSFLNDHIWSFRNQCKCDPVARDRCITDCSLGCSLQPIGAPSA